jgi:UDP-N-acetylmuramoyl-tripeptide--D-alanyl-D-alanine ligase
LEGFGSLEAVLQEKVSLTVGAPTAVVGTKPPTLPEAAKQAAKQVTTVGIEGPADWIAESVTMREGGRPSFVVRGVAVELPLRGRHMVANALVALAVADAVGVPLKDAAAALAHVTIPGGRSEISEVGGVTLINDCYNANPTSLLAALDLARDLRGSRRVVAVVGTMRELGKDAEAMHLEAARAVLAMGPDVVAAVGDFAPAFAALPDTKAVTLVSGKTPEDVAEALKRELKPGDIVLLKASRGVQLERLVPLLWPELAAAAAGAH